MSDIKSEVLAALNIVNFRLASMYEGSDVYTRDRTEREFEAIQSHLDEVLTVLEDEDFITEEDAEKALEKAREKAREELRLWLIK